MAGLPNNVKDADSKWYIFMKVLIIMVIMRFMLANILSNIPFSRFEGKSQSGERHAGGKINRTSTTVGMSIEITVM